MMITFPLILILGWVFLSGEVGLDPTPTNHELASQASDDNSDVPLTASNDNAAWYYSKKLWGCVLFVGLAVVAYYLKGLAPASPDDMASLNTAVSAGIPNISSEQASLSVSLSERVNSAEFRADLLNRSTEGILSDIVAAGEAARFNKYCVAASKSEPN